MTEKKASRPKPLKSRETSGPASELILYQTEDGRTRIECRFEDETIWLSQALMADLFQTSVQNVNLHILNILEDGEAGEATIKDYLIVRTESGREVRRTVKHYNLDAEDQAKRRRVLYMKDWRERLDAFLKFNERDVLDNPGKVSKEVADRLAEDEYERFHVRRLAADAEADEKAFDVAVKSLPTKGKGN